jgi:glycolate oxidase subunit GlcD
VTAGQELLSARLRAIVGADYVLPPTAGYVADETETRGLRGSACVVVLPGTTDEVAAVLRACYASDIPVFPRGGGTGYAGGAVPLNNGCVVGLERLNRVRAFDPLLWRMNVEAGVTTSEVRRRAHESGLLFPPDPGAAESSHIGGNIATNAGGPHAFKYGVTGSWVTGLEVVLPPGEVVSIGGPVRKDVGGYDLKNLLIGSEGTLGIVTAAWLRLIPAPETAFPVIGFYPSAEAGVAAIESVLGNGLLVSALEYLDGRVLAASASTLPFETPGVASFAVIAEADGTRVETEALAEDIESVLSDGCTSIHALKQPAEIARLWRWREGVSIAVTAQRGGKISEDIVVPVDRLREALAGLAEIGARYGVETCSWGHAGDGNLHATFLIDPSNTYEIRAAEAATESLFELAVELGGAISGEHGVGLVKRRQLSKQWPERALELHEQIKRLFDPRDLLNPGKKLAR